jgi:glucose/mannose transport system substrate-binding protein
MALVAAAAAPQRAAAADQKLEIFTYWTAGGEADGLAALEKVFASKFPGVNVTNAVVAGGAGSNATAVLATRMQGGHPPDTFQIHGGAELLETWVKTGFMQPLGKLYEAEGLNQKFPKQLIDLVSWQGQPYSVPVNVHRNGVLWFNKKLFTDNGIAAPKTWDEFFAAAEKLKAKGVTPLALGDKDKWESLQLFENILLATLGPDSYKQLWAGKFAWTDPKVTKSLETMKKVLAYVNDDHSALTWDQASGLVLRGKAAMNLMGDWAKGYFTSNGWQVGTDFGWAPAPGTQGSFIVVTDTFGLPKGAKNAEAAMKWLATCASVPGQDAFNPKKGSIPARIDADKSLYDAYSREAMADFAKDALVPSQANGPATVPAFLTPITDAIATFVNDKDVAKAQATIAAACKETGACPKATAAAPGASSTGTGGK